MVTQDFHPRPETTLGIFLEHFDLSCPSNGLEVIVYRQLVDAAEQAAALAGWHFRSYSKLATAGTCQDYFVRNIRSFPMLILYRDGIELGRSCICMNPVEEIISWGNRLLGEMQI